MYGRDPRLGEKGCSGDTKSVHKTADISGSKSPSNHNRKTSAQCKKIKRDNRVDVNLNTNLLQVIQEAPKVSFPKQLMKGIYCYWQQNLTSLSPNNETFYENVNMRGDGNL